MARSLLVLLQMEDTTLENAWSGGSSMLQEIVREIARTIESRAALKAVFGEPVKLAGHTVMPVATVFVSFGGGLGVGGRLGIAVERGAGLASRFLPRLFGGGAGGGLNVSVRPVGFIEDGAEGLRFTAIAVPQR